MSRHSTGGVMVRRFAGNGLGSNPRHIYFIRIIRRGEGAEILRPVYRDRYWRRELPVFHRRERGPKRKLGLQGL